MKQISILIVDDHALMRQGLQQIIELEEDFTVCGMAENGEKAIEMVKSLKPDIVLMDVAMPGLDPFTASAELGRCCPTARVVFLSAHIRDHYLDAAFRAGAWGYLYKGDDIDDIILAIQRVAQGEYVFSPRVLERVRVRGATDRPGVPNRTSKLTTLTTWRCRYSA